MDTLTNVEEVEKEGNIIPFKVITGGKPPGNNWLINLKPGDQFLCAPKGKKTHLAFEYNLDAKIEKWVKLCDTVSNPMGQYFWVNSEGFCTDYDFCVLIGEVIPWETS